MKQLILDEIKQKAIPVLKQAGVTRAAIFGSVARGEQTVKSDLDILVDLPKGMSLFDVIDLEDKLEAVVNRKVDLVDYEAIKPRLKPYIMQDQIQII
ncbi:MAG TPA: nucleotidyltransferase family protein [Candidatus Saccharimonadales bacterium]|nr:nucleotidyltransferase family protein [Candidatus Saccharimonadales bacterium]